MKSFMAVYIGSPSAPRMQEWMSMEEGKRKQMEAAGIKKWGDWMKSHAAGIADGGGPLGKTKKVSAKGIGDIKNAMTGFVVVKAESHEAAAKMFENHPSFSHFPGDSVEIMEILPIPGG